MRGIVEHITYNKPQLRLFLYILNKIKSATSIWGRGTGKSFVIALLMHSIIKMMPRSKWAIIGQTYLQIRTRTIPSTKASLSLIGYEEGVDYLIGRKPPPSWRWIRPLEDPVDYTHVMCFPNGTIFQFVSLDGGTGARGMNVDGVISDETLEQKKEKLDQQVKATNRGNLKRFGHVNFHHGTFYFTSMPYGSDGRWLIDEGSHIYNDTKFDFKLHKRKLVEQQLNFFKAEDLEHRLEIWRMIRHLKAQVKWKPALIKKGRPHLKLYTEADPFDNIDNLGIIYLEDLFQDMSLLTFLVEVLNYYPDKIEHGFYPWLDDAKHGYTGADNNDYIALLNDEDEALRQRDSRMDADCVATQPLQIALDWGAKITSMTIGQHFTSINTFRFINELYVKHPKILNDLAEDFCKYYKHHEEKKVVFLYDHTGNTSQANAKLTYSEQFAQVLRKNKWNVQFAARKSGVSHMDKHLIWGKLLQHSNTSLPKIEFNLTRCRYTVISMHNAGIKETSRGFEKDKSSERSAFIPQEEATHLSDTADMHVVSLFSSLLDTHNYSLPSPIGS